MDEKEVAVGDVVTYKDEVGTDHQALVLHVHSQNTINLLYLSSDEAKSDSYGRQIERASSVQRKSEWTANGRYFVA